MLELLLVIGQTVILPFIVSVAAGLFVIWIRRYLTGKRKGVAEADFPKKRW